MAVIGNALDNLRSGSRLSSFTLETARALFPPLGSHLGLLEGLSVADCDDGTANAIGRKHILTFA
jgi:hypothetical protein